MSVSTWDAVRVQNAMQRGGEGVEVGREPRSVPQHERIGEGRTRASESQQLAKAEGDAVTRKVSMDSVYTDHRAASAAVLGGLPPIPVHVPTDDERRRDAATVERIYAQMGHDAAVTFSPDDAVRGRIEREDEEANWANLLSAAPDVAMDEDDCGRCAKPMGAERFLSKTGRYDVCQSCREQEELDAVTPRFED